jgi:hypothetical protein
LTPGSGFRDGKNIRSQDPGYVMNIPDLFLRTWYQFIGFKILKFFDAVPGSKILLTLIWIGMDKIRPVSRINIWDPQH